MDFHREGNGFLAAVTQAERRHHIPFGRDAQTGTTTFRTPVLDLEPEFLFGPLHIPGLGILFHLGQNPIHMLQFQVDDIVHEPLGNTHMLAEQFHIEMSLRRERVFHITIQVQRQQTAAVVRTQRNLPARIGRNRPESQVGIAIRHRLADNRIPKKHTGFGRLPSIVDNLVPQLAGIDFLSKPRLVGIDRVLLHERLVFDHCLHEFIGQLHRNVGSRHLAFLHLGIDELFRIRMLDTDAQHQRAAAAVLRHLARGIGVTFHERHDTGACQRAVLDRAACRTYMREVMPHAAAALHQLHLLLVDLHDAAVGIGIAPVAHYETVGQGRNLELVPNPGHRAPLRDDIAEMLHQGESFLFRYRIRVTAFDAMQFPGNPVVHIVRRLFIDTALAVLERVFVHPDRSSQRIAAEILGSRLQNLFRSIFRQRPFLFFFNFFFHPGRCRYRSVVHGRCRLRPEQAFLLDLFHFVPLFLYYIIRADVRSGGSLFCSLYFRE